MESGSSKNTTSEQTKVEILKAAKDLVAKGVIPRIRDFEKQGILYYDILTLFGGLQKLLEECGVSTPKRQKNMSDDEIKVYLKNITNVDQNGCWLTTSRHVNKNINRMQIKYKGKLILLYQLTYLLFRGAIPAKPLVLSHICNNSLCYNPDHLEVKTQQENINYCVEQKRNTGYDRTNITRTMLENPYDYPKLLQIVKTKVEISPKNEWLYKGRVPKAGYPVKRINKEDYYLHRLILANKLGKKYEEIDRACHRLPDGSQPQKHDLNPDHLFEGTQSDNMKDTLKYRKDRMLTDEIIIKLKEELKIAKKETIWPKFDQEMSLKLDVPTRAIKKFRLGMSFAALQDGNVYKTQIEKPILQFDLNNNLISKYASASKAAKLLNLPRLSITTACKENKVYNNFKWQFE